MAKNNSGAIVTLGLDVTAEYTCSACGKENSLPDTARVTGSAASILALKKAGKGRDLLPLLPGGLQEAGLGCVCSCGHREPWAKLRSPRLEQLQKILLWVLAGLTAAAYLLHTGGGAVVAMLLTGMGLSAAALAAVTAATVLRRRAARRALEALPEASLPRLKLR